MGGADGRDPAFRDAGRLVVCMRRGGERGERAERAEEEGAGQGRDPHARCRCTTCTTSKSRKRRRGSLARHIQCLPEKTKPPATPPAVQATVSAGPRDGAVRRRWQLVT